MVQGELNRILRQLFVVSYSQENIPKDEETMESELEELKCENDFLAHQSLQTADHKNKLQSRQPAVRERQISNDEFISL